MQVKRLFTLQVQVNGDALSIDERTYLKHIDPNDIESIKEVGPYEVRPILTITMRSGDKLAVTEQANPGLRNLIRWMARPFEHYETR